MLQSLEMKIVHKFTFFQDYLQQKLMEKTALFVNKIGTN